MDKIFCYNCFHEKVDAQADCPNCGYNVEQDKNKYPLALPHGTILNGRYILGRVLGQGGFGITYVARDWKTNRLTAIKEYLPDGISTRVGSHMVTVYSGQQGENFGYGKECFLNEAKTLAEFIGNPNIVQVYCYFEENGTAYFVMDYIEGISFQQYILNQGGKIDWQKAEELFFPVMDALAAIHSRGVIHRDVTPDNIYITEDGTVKLLDFGAARYSMGDRSRSLDIVLKHGFAPKEQYTRHGHQGPYTDVYSVTASFYYAITGRKPPDSIDRMEEDDLVPPHSLGIDIPDYIEKALYKGLAVQPVDRFQNMSQLKAAMSNRTLAERTVADNTVSNGGSAAVTAPQSDVPQAGTTAHADIAVAGESKWKWLIPIISAGVAVAALLVIAVMFIGGRKSESEDTQALGNGATVADERKFLDLDSVGASGKMATTEESDSYDSLYQIFISQTEGEREAFFIYDDFDNDGINEAFGITGADEASDLYNHVKIYFLQGDGSITDISPEEEFYGYLGDEVLDTGAGKFIVWEMSAGGMESLSYIFGVKDGSAYEPGISGECMGFNISEYRDLYYSITYGYNMEYYAFDAETGEFIEAEDPNPATSAEIITARYYGGTAFYEDYVLPDSSERLYTIYELNSLNRDQLKIARNEIYARHGRKFQDAELQSYFDACSWYIGYIEPAEFDQERIFNDYEKENVLVIQKCEKE